MKNFFLLLAALLALAVTRAQAQRTEFSARLSGNIFWFGGSGAPTRSAVMEGSFIPYTFNPYGGGAGVGYGLGLRAQRVTKSGLLLAGELGLERVHNHIAIDSMQRIDFNSFPWGLYAESASGSTRFITGFATAYGGLGQRLRVGKLALDLLAGPEASLRVGAHEVGYAVSESGQVASPDRRIRGWLPLDARLRAEANLWRGHLGLQASYSHGLQSYYTNAPTYSRTLRLGLAYRL